MVLAFPVAAAAAVCDKGVGVHWRPGNGPTWTVTFPRSDGTTVSLAVWAIVAAIPCFPVLMTFSRRVSLPVAIVLRWIGYAAAGLIVLGAFFAIHAAIVPEGLAPSHLVAAREGCIVFRADWRAIAVNAAMVGVVVLPYLWMAFRMRRHERHVDARHRQTIAS